MSRCTTTTSAHVELVGCVSRVAWFDDDQPFSILKLISGESVKIAERSDKFKKNRLYRFLGRREENVVFGPTIHAETFCEDTPLTKAGVCDYLAEHCNGIGQGIAAKAFTLWGVDCVRVIREEPGKVAAAKLLSLEAAEEAAKSLRAIASGERTRIELFQLLKGKGFPSTVAKDCLRKWGARAAEVVRRNPYKLLAAGIGGVGFKRADALALVNGQKVNSLRRRGWAAVAGVDGDRTGSTWVESGPVLSSVAELCGEHTQARLQRAITWGKRTKRLEEYRGDGVRLLSTPERAAAERRIAERVALLTRCPAKWPGEISGSTLSEHQAEQLRQATSKAVGVLCGGPGTGKTYTLAQLVRYLVDRYGSRSIAVAAPTGKAAVRSSEMLKSIGVEVRATTVHRLLGGGMGKGWTYRAGNPLPYDWVVVDEPSMLDTALAADLFDAIRVDDIRPCHVLLVGDPQQLPPVGHGAPFRDLIASECVGVGKLTEVRRNAGLAVAVCKQIAAGEDISPLPSTFDFSKESPDNLRVIALPAGPEQLADYVAELVREHGAENVQCIVPMNTRGDWCRRKLNELIAASVIDADRSLCPVAVGDRIICLENGRYDNDGVNERGESIVEVANGEIGDLVELKNGKAVVKFDSSRRVLVRIPKRKLPQPSGATDDGEAAADKRGVLGAFDLAWAITVHKSQGSEWHHVVAVIDPGGGPIADRNYWYTAISRMRTTCTLLGDEAVFRAQCKANKMRARRTRLVELVREKIKGRA